MRKAIIISLALIISTTAFAQQPVDLGLSVKWASCNLGASAPEQYGDYYAWAETSTKTVYDWKRYKYMHPEETKSTYMVSKYCTNEAYGLVDKKKDLEPADDAARAKLGGKWRLPTRAEWEELEKQCNWTWTTQKGVNGYLVTSIKNGKSIFLPAAGHKFVNETSGEGSLGFYLSNTLGYGLGQTAWNIFFGSAKVMEDNFDRCLGHSVRAVCE